MKKITQVINLLKNKETIKKHNVTKIVVMSYVSIIFDGRHDLLLTTHTLIYPHKEVLVKSRSFPIFIEEKDINKKNGLWQFTFLIECFGQNLNQLKEYIEDDCKGFIDFIYVYNEPNGTERLSVQFILNLEKLQYL